MLEENKLLFSIFIWPIHTYKYKLYEVGHEELLTLTMVFEYMLYEP